MSTQSINPEEGLHHLEGHYADRVSAFRQRLARVGLDRVLIILLDIGKNVHWAAASLASGLELVRPYRLPSTQTGLTQFVQMTNTLITEHNSLLVLLSHEPTGVYHEPWARALMDRYACQLQGQAGPAFEYRFFNPYQVKLARRQTHLRHRKTDPRDLAAMLDLMLRGLGQPAFLPTGTNSSSARRSASSVPSPASSATWSVSFGSNSTVCGPAPSSTLDSLPRPILVCPSHPHHRDPSSPA